MKAAVEGVTTKRLHDAVKTGPPPVMGHSPTATEFGSIVFNCTHGGASLDALTLAGRDNLRGKVLVDVANPLSETQRGVLQFCNTESLGEGIQTAFPDTKVVKALNTMWCGVIVNPRRLP